MPRVTQGAIIGIVYEARTDGVFSAMHDNVEDLNAAYFIARDTENRCLHVYLYKYGADRVLYLVQDDKGLQVFP